MVAKLRNLSGTVFRRVTAPLCLWTTLTLTLSITTALGDDPDWSSLPYTPFSEMQRVNNSGWSTWSVPYDGAGNPGYTLRGVVINNPAEMLDSTPNFLPWVSGGGNVFKLGGQWQVFVQAYNLLTDGGDVRTLPLVGDFGGAALWMGQNYGNLPWIHDTNRSYTNAEWSDSVSQTGEMYRLNYPKDSAGNTVTEPLRYGDLVEVHARGGLEYNGKFNVNEQHEKDPGYDFDVQILQRNLAPQATSISLSDVKNPDGGFKFQQDRTSGAEHYQSTLVRLDNVSLVDSTGWGPDASLTIAQGNLQLPLKLGRLGFDWSTKPAGPFNVVGIFDQDGADRTAGYLLRVMDPGQIFVVPEPSTIAMVLGGGLSGLAIFGLRWYRHRGAGRRGRGEHRAGARRRVDHHSHRRPVRHHHPRRRHQP